MTMMSTASIDNYKIFLEHNSLGVSNLRNGHVREAYKHLRQAFEIAKHEQNKAAQDHKHHQQQQQQEQEEESSASSQTYCCVNKNMMPVQYAPAVNRLMVTRRISWPQISRKETIATLSMTKSFDLRTDGLMITTSVPDHALAQRAEREGSFIVDWGLAGAFAVFNIGIVYSIRGVQEEASKNEEFFHSKARTMFESCIELIIGILLRHANNQQSTNKKNQDSCSGGTDRGQLCPTGNPLVDILCLMVLAKTAQAHYFLSMFDGAKARTKQFDDFTRLLREEGSAVYANDKVIDRLVESICKRFSSELASLQKLDATAPMA